MTSFFNRGIYGVSAKKTKGKPKECAPHTYVLDTKEKMWICSKCEAALRLATEEDLQKDKKMKEDMLEKKRRS